MASDEALREILLAVEAWTNDTEFGLQTDAERRFDCDSDFLEYIGEVAHKGWRDGQA